MAQKTIWITELKTFKINKKKKKKPKTPLLKLKPKTIHYFLIKDRLLLPPSHFICPLFHFRMFQNIILFLKIKEIGRASCRERVSSKV